MERTNPLKSKAFYKLNCTLKKEHSNKKKIFKSKHMNQAIFILDVNSVYDPCSTTHKKEI